MVWFCAGFAIKDTGDELPNHMPVFWLFVLAAIVFVAGGAAFNIREGEAPQADRVTSGPVAGGATRLARLVAWLDDQAWSDDLAALAGGRAAPRARAAMRPTYGEVARVGTALVVGASASAGRWDEAGAQARHLRRFFGVVGMRPGPDRGTDLRRAARRGLASDPDELDDFVDLIEEMFTLSDAPPASRHGRLLVAAPALDDPNFRRTVVLMLEHSADGALGLVLNRPTPLVSREALPAGPRRR